MERTNYYAKSGSFDQVLALRRKACTVRGQLGLPPGEIFTKHNANDEGPDVTWQCRFSSVKANEVDLAARKASAEFEQVRKSMGEVIDRFERHFSCLETRAPEPQEISLAGHKIVPKQVQFKSGDKSLAGYLYLPPIGDGPFPCIITNHGSAINQGTMDLCRPGTASLLMSWGYASFLPHRTGYGNSPGNGWLKEVSAEFGTPEYDQQLSARLDRESDDVVAALDWLSTQTEIDSKRIGVMGSSFGGTVTLLAAAKTDRFTCAVEFAGAAMNWEHTPDLRHKMMNATRQLKCPIFFLQSETDYSVAPTRELGNIVMQEQPNSQSKIYPPFGLSKDEGHFFERSGSLVWGQDVREFLLCWM